MADMAILGKNISSLGSTAGEGILIKLKGNDAHRFIQNEDNRFWSECIYFRAR